MANYFLNDDGSLTKKKKKIKGKSYVMDSSGRISLESSDEIAPVKTTSIDDLRAKEKKLQSEINTIQKTGKKNEWWSDDRNFLENVGNVGYKLFLETDDLQGEDLKKKKQLEKELLSVQDQIDNYTVENTELDTLDKIGYTMTGNLKTGLKGIESTINKGVATILGVDVENDNQYLDIDEKLAQKSRQETDGIYGIGLDVLGSTSRMIPQLAIGNPAGAMTMGFANYGGGAYNEAKREGATEEQATRYGITVGTLEMAMEKVLGGFESVYGKSAAGQITNKVMGKVISNQAFRKVASGMAGEFTEEYLQEFLEPIVKNVILEQDNGADFWNTMQDDFGEGLKQLSSQFFNMQNLQAGFTGAITSGVVGAQSNYDAYKYNKITGRDLDTGLTSNEQSVVDKVTSQRTTEAQKEIALNNAINQEIEEFESTFGTMTEAEKKVLRDRIKEQLDNGEIDYSTSKLSKKEISKIEQQVRTDLEKGYIDIETIEDTLVSDKTAQIKALEQELANTKDATKKAEIQAKINELQSAKASELKEVLNKDIYLQRSYREANLKGEKFAYESKETDSEYRKALAKDFEKIANNTAKSHETFEMLSKIAEAKQTNYGVINNEQLKKLGYDIEGKDVNGLVRTNKDGTQKVLINLDSSKAINRIVGHETTHLLEGTKEYTELQQMVKEYAETKGDYNRVLNEFTKLYDGTDADIENEITSELVGDYLFTDEQFVNNLSVQKPNIFQKIYNEIKHLYKLATAGSEEARKLEKVKHAFDKAYKQNASKTSETDTNDADVKYSLTDSQARTTSKELIKRIEEIKNQREELRQQLLELRQERKNITENIPNYSMFKQYDELNDINKRMDDNKNLSKELYAELQEKESKLEEIKEQEKNERIAREEAEATPHKLAQNRIIQKTNPMLDDYHTGIRSVGDIKTWQEAMEEAERLDEGYSWGDFSKEDAEKSLKRGTIRVYSSYAIKNGVFVSTSYQQALDYAGGDRGKVHSKVVALDSVAWISVDEGQYAKVYNTKYSLSEAIDNQGRELTKEQQEYFKDSKVRDENGNLKIVYHGSNVTDITVFKKDKFGDVGINFLTDDPDIADTYRKKSGRRYEFYADIKNPLVIDGEGKNWNDILVGDNPVAEKMYNSLTESEKTYLTDLAKKMSDTYSREDAIEGFYQRINAYDEGLYDRLSEVTGIRGKIFDAALNDWSDTYAKDLLGKRKNTNQLVREAYDSGNYDGVIFKNIVDRGMNFHKAIGERVSNVYVTFNSNQIKNIDNTNPTSSEDIRYSLGNQEQAPVRGDVFGSDIKLQVEEVIAPLKEEIAELKEELASTVEETYKPTTMDDLEGWEAQTREDLSNIERDIAPIETEQTYDYIPDTITMDKKSLNTLSKNIKKELNLSKVQTTELESIIQEMSNSETATKEDLFDAIQERFSEQTIEYKNEELVNIKRDLRKYRIYVDDYLKSEFRDGFNKIRQQNFNKLKFTNDGSSVDSVYQELSEIYPAYFPNDINNAQDQLQRIIDVANYDVVDVENYVIPEESIQEITDYIYDSIQDYKLDQHIKSGEEARKLPIDESLIPSVVNDSNTQVNKDNAPIRRNVDWDSIEDTSKGKQVTFNEETQALEEEDLVKKTKKELRKALLGTEAQKEFITNALDNAKNRSMALMNNTDTIRNTELVFGRDAGKVINEFIFQKEIDNEADSIAWQNKERQEIKDLGIKARSKESAAVQKYGEKQYVNDAGEVIAYGDTELAKEFSDVATRNKIKRAAKVIRNKYDNYIDRANEVLTKLGFDPIPKRKDYMRHFQELTDVFSNFGIPFNAKSMAEHDLPTDINGLTENWSPQKNYFASMQRRKGLKTNYDAITGVDGYIGGIANLIYHTEDIQRGRAFEELIRETYGQDKGFENLENLPDELKQARAEKIQDNHLSNYAAWLHEWTNHVAGKKNKIDRSVESMFGRKGFSFLDNARKQVGSNMIGFNLSSSLTNLIAPVQAAAKTNKLALLKGTADTIKNIFVKDNFMDNNKFLTSRMGSDMISKNAWQKVQDAGFIFMKGMDWFSSNQIVRSKYYELRAKGMSEQQAHAEAGQFAARILGDRTKGANAQLYNSKLVGLVTQFQLEVNNQLYSMFYDTYHESKENAQNNALKTAAGMTFTLGQLFAFTHLFGQTFEAIAGYNPTLDVIEILKTALGWGEDDDDEEKTTSERLKAAADQLVDSLPYVNILTGGGRIPVASGIPNLVGVATGGKDQYGNELTLEDEMKKLLYLLPPTGGNQVKKTTQGLAMFDEDLPVKGSYTDSGNLRYPVEDTPLNRVQAALFGQYANKNAGEYFDDERAPLKEKQIQEYKELGMPISEYWKYRDGLKKQKTTEDKFNYINSLDVSNEQKNIMINNVVDRKEAVDMSNYGNFGSYEEFDFATKNPEKYKIIQQIDTFDNYMTYRENISDIKERYSSDKGYSTEQRKAAVQQYIESLNLSVPQKIMLEKMAGGYSIKGYEEYMYGFIESLNMTAKEKQALHKELFN